MVDDLADNYTIRDKVLLEKSISIPWDDQKNFFGAEIGRAYKSFLQRQQYWKPDEIEEKEKLVKPVISTIPDNIVKWIRM